MKEKKWKRLIWFREDSWINNHAVIGINGDKTICGIKRSTRKVSYDEKYWHGLSHFGSCRRCLAGVKRRFGCYDAYTVLV